MPDLIHFCTVATVNMDGLHDDMLYLKDKYSDELLHIEYTIIAPDRAILSGTMWVTDGGSGDLELGSMCVDYKVLEPFYLNIK